jgi:DNA-binding beta-propeller fold protein YncE
VLATRDSGERATTQGITATLRIPGHPGSVAAGADVLWVALSGDPRRPAGDRPLLRLDLATGTVAQAVDLGGEVSALARDGGRLIASVKPAGTGELGHRRLVALDWRSGVVLPLGESHLSDTDARVIDGPVDQVVRAGKSLWALEDRPARLLQLDPSTLTAFPPIRLSSGRTSGLAAGDGFLWVTATDAGEVLRIDPATGAITRAHVDGSPVGIAVVGGDVWFADRSNGNVVRLDARSLRPIGDPIPVGAKPTGLGVAGGSLFVFD